MTLAAAALPTTPTFCSLVHENSRPELPPRLGHRPLRGMAGRICILDGDLVDHPGESLVRPEITGLNTALLTSAATTLGRLHMHACRFWLVLIPFVGGCSNPPNAESAKSTLARLTQPSDSTSLAFYLAQPQPNAVAGSPMAIQITVARTSSNRTERPESLLAGRFIATFVPADRQPECEPESHYVDFSGGGGIDYTGQLPLSISVPTPSVPGSYWLHVTVHSTPGDVRFFLMTARLSASAGPWWTGCVSTQPRRVVVAATDP